ncbi:MAG: peroxide stress protein YaaA [Pseudomonadota bacterium]
MLFVISPAKTLDFETPPPVAKTTMPDFLGDSAKLIRALKKLDASEIRSLMGISEQLASLNKQRYQSWRAKYDDTKARPAATAFRGDVYQGLEADSLSARDWTFAQKHLRILSGLYGVLRPLDLILPYRLEMGSALEVGRQSNLYDFWGPKLALALNEQARAAKSRALVNLASNEYFRAVDQPSLDLDVITPVFKDYKSGQYKIVSFYAKKARGWMARYIIDNRIKRADDLTGFNTGGYAYDPKQSDDRTLVFTRDKPA